jgi:hypothetical protein
MNIHLVNNSLAMEIDACHFLAIDVGQFLAMDDLGRPPESLITKPGRPLRAPIRSTYASSGEEFFAWTVSIPSPRVRPNG